MITEKQKDLLNLIEKFISENGYSPTARELADLEGVYQNATQDRLKQLKAKGLIDWIGNKSRTIRIVKPI